MRESAFWARIKADVAAGVVPGHWQRVEVKYPLGYPDAHVIVDGRSVLVELKSVDRPSDIPAAIRPEQATFARRWKKRGGECYLYVFVASLGRAFWFDSAFEAKQGAWAPIECPLHKGS